ncbi:hypothetical protein AB6A40_007748 [Gnathostoma spinigerum]|uniref:Uncharacterized protein n=1 Tax=Gnathostoma spinigerum TaxID=75299 RepID=A0ABD6ES98_9BILA
MSRRLRESSTRRVTCCVHGKPCLLGDKVGKISEDEAERDVSSSSYDQVGRISRRPETEQTKIPRRRDVEKASLDTDPSAYPNNALDESPRTHSQRQRKDMRKSSDSKHNRVEADADAVNGYRSNGYEKIERDEREEPIISSPTRYLPKKKVSKASLDIPLYSCQKPQFVSSQSSEASNEYIGLIPQPAKTVKRYEDEDTVGRIFKRHNVEREALIDHAGDKDIHLNKMAVVKAENSNKSVKPDGGEYVVLNLYVETRELMIFKSFHSITSATVIS